MRHQNHKMPMKTMSTKAMTVDMTKHHSPAAMTRPGQSYVSKKISKLRHEGKSQKAAIGQAFGMARQKGYKVPRKKK